MNFNLSSILSSSLRFLNITKQPEKKELTFKEKPVQKNNSLTFFR